METTYLQQHEIRSAPKQIRLSAIPAHVYQQISHLLNQYETFELYNYIDTISAHHPCQHGNLKLITENEVDPCGGSALPHTPSAKSGDTIPCACPSCWTNFSRISDMKRHFFSCVRIGREDAVRGIVAREEESNSCRGIVFWKCPGCLSTFSRKDHFRAHHLGAHECHHYRCLHDNTAMTLNVQFAALACGFCREGSVFTITTLSDVLEYLEHMTNHFRLGAQRDDWNTTHQLRSLLTQPHVYPMWQSFGRAHYAYLHGEMADHFEMTWDLEYGHVKIILHVLERRSSPDELQQCLQQLFTAGRISEVQKNLQRPVDSLIQPSIVPRLPADIISNAISSDFSGAMLSGWQLPPTATEPNEIIGVSDDWRASTICDTEFQDLSTQTTLHSSASYGTAVDQDHMSHMSDVYDGMLLTDADEFVAGSYWAGEDGHLQGAMELTSQEAPSLFPTFFNPTAPVDWEAGHKRSISGRIVHELRHHLHL